LDDELRAWLSLASTLTCWGSLFTILALKSGSTIAQYFGLLRLSFISGLTSICNGRAFPYAFFVGIIVQYGFLASFILGRFIFVQFFVGKFSLESEVSIRILKPAKSQVTLTFPSISG
jgi:hypothetical protein